MDEVERLKSELNQLSIIVDELETKVNDLYSRPLMPFSQNANSGDILALDVNLVPEWITP